MKNQYTFSSLLIGEHYKTKRNFAVFTMLAFPLLIALIVMAYLIYKSADGVTMPFNPWIGVLGNGIFGFYSFYPLITAILCYSLCDMEYKNDSFKQLFTLPFTKKSIFGVKILFLAEIILLSSFIAFISFLGTGMLLGYAIPDYEFQNYAIIGTASLFFTKIFLFLLAVAVIQYCLSLLFKSFVIPVGIACFMTIFSVVLQSLWEKSYLIPYCSIYNTLNSFYRGTLAFDKYDIFCIVYIIVLSVAGYYIMKMRSVNTK